jgi:VWFA-related protein
MIRGVALLLAAWSSTLLVQTPRFTTGVAAVRVDVIVTNGNRPVAGLSAADFDVRDNGVVQRVADVNRETLPLNVICVLDVSSSVRGPALIQLKSGMRALIDALAAGDRAALVTFSERLHLHTPLTGDREKLRALIQTVQAGGATSVLDAAFTGLALREADPGRTLMLILSDGRDTASWLTVRRVLDTARRTDVVIYPVTARLGSSDKLPGAPVPRYRGTTDEGERLLEAFADETGGRVFRADNERGLEKAFTAVLSEFRSRYVLTYTPENVGADGWHTIEVKLRRKAGDVKARRGYFAMPARDSTARTPPK